MFWRHHFFSRIADGIFIVNVVTDPEAKNCPVCRMAAHETNKFVMLVDPLLEQTGFVQVLEIFAVAGFTPPNQHRAAAGSLRLYCLTIMVPDEDFAKLITSGAPDALDAEDLAVLGWG